jgi:tetratricopeptide (TPR) repeat protein
VKFKTLVTFVVCLGIALVIFAIAVPVQLVISDDTSACRNGLGDEAIVACSRLLALNPKDAAGYYSHGLTYHYKGDYDRAIADFDQAVSSIQAMLTPMRRVR